MNPGSVTCYLDFFTLFFFTFLFTLLASVHSSVKLGGDVSRFTTSGLSWIPHFSLFHTSNQLPNLCFSFTIRLTPKPFSPQSHHLSSDSHHFLLRFFQKPNSAPSNKSPSIPGYPTHCYTQHTFWRRSSSLPQS